MTNFFFLGYLIHVERLRNGNSRSADVTRGHHKTTNYACFWPFQTIWHLF